MTADRSLFDSRFCYFPDCHKGPMPEWCGNCGQRELASEPRCNCPNGYYDHHGRHLAYCNLVSESGLTARPPTEPAPVEEVSCLAASDPAGTGASSPRRSLAEIRASGAAWIAEAEIARICDAVNEAETATSRAHDALYADPFDRKAASDAIWRIHDILRGLRDGG